MWKSNLISYYLLLHCIHVYVHVSVQVTKTKWCDMTLDEKLILENAIEKAKDKLNGRSYVQIGIPGIHVNLPQ